MNHQPTTRRNFLANMAVLSAGAALAPVTSLFAEERQRTDLKQHWDVFCRKNGGQACTEHIVAEAAQIEACRGHFHQTGKPVYFPEENLLAQPTWIYWNEAMKNPEDVVVSFFSNDGDKKKLFSLNRFEMEGINSLKIDDVTQNCLRLLKEHMYARNTGKKQAGGLSMKTCINRQKAQTTVAFRQETTLIQNNIVHHI